LWRKPSFLLIIPCSKAMAAAWRYPVTKGTYPKGTEGLVVTFTHKGMDEV
jgi:hypothetical protein